MGERQHRCPGDLTPAPSLSKGSYNFPLFVSAEDFYHFRFQRQLGQTGSLGVENAAVEPVGF